MMSLSISAKAHPPSCNGSAFRCRRITGKVFLSRPALPMGFSRWPDDTEILYLVTAYYNPEKEDALNAQDSMIGIKWPEKITGLSDKDKAVPFIDQTYHGIINTTKDIQ